MIDDERVWDGARIWELVEAECDVEWDVACGIAHMRAAAFFCLAGSQGVCCSVGSAAVRSTRRSNAVRSMQMQRYLRSRRRNAADPPNERKKDNGVKRVEVLTRRLEPM